MKDDKTILVLGGGVGGLVTANLLRKSLSTNHRVILFDKEADHLFSPALLWLMINKRKSKKIHKPIIELEKKGIEVIQGEINLVDPHKREIEVDGTKYSGDYIVIALGADLFSDGIPGLTDGGYNFYTLKGAEKFRQTWSEFKSGKVVIITSKPLYKCPAAPYEIAMLLEDDSRKKKANDQIHIELYTAEPGPMGVTGKDNSNAVRMMVEQKGVNYYPDHQIESVDGESRNLLFTNGTEVDYDILAYVPPHRAPDVIQKTELIDSSGWVSVNANTLETSFNGVYAIGDITGIPLTLGKPLPKAGVFAHNHAEVVANNIAVKINEKGNSTEYEGDGACIIETGDGRAGYGKGNFYAQPVPQIKMYTPRRYWYWGKLLFEKRWFRKWF